MGLLDNLAHAMLSKVDSEQGKMVQIALDLLNQHGGLSGVLEKFIDNGMAAQVSSWVSTGANLPISAEQVTNVLGSRVMADIAGKFDISPDALGNTIAEHLPNMVDKMTPDGLIPTGGSVISTLLNAFK